MAHVDYEAAKRIVSDVIDILIRFIPPERRADAREAMRLYVEEHYG
jgi:hypothetical protein